MKRYGIKQRKKKSDIVDNNDGAHTKDRNRN